MAITVRVEPHFRDYFRFTLWAVYRMRFLVFMIGIIPLFYFVAAPLLPHDESLTTLDLYRISLGMLIMPGILFIVLPLIGYFAARRTWNKSPDLRVPRTYDFDDQGMHVKGDTFESSLTWPHFTTAQTAAGFILLSSGQPAFHLIPLKAFGSATELEAFKSLLRTHVKDCRKLR